MKTNLKKKINLENKQKYYLKFKKKKCTGKVIFKKEENVEVVILMKRVFPSTLKMMENIHHMLTTKLL